MKKKNRMIFIIIVCCIVMIVFFIIINNKTKINEENNNIIYNDDEQKIQELRNQYNINKSDEEINEMESYEMTTEEILYKEQLDAINKKEINNNFKDEDK